MDTKDIETSGESESAAAIASDFVCTPSLVPAGDIVIAILKLCENMRTNRHTLLGLGGHCKSLLYVLKDNEEQLAPEKKETIAESCVKILEDIKGKLADWTDSSVFKQLTLQDNIAEDIKCCHLAIESFLATFQITFSTGAEDWKTHFEVSRDQDHKEVVEYLSDIKNDAQLARETLAAKKADITNMMAYVQNLLGRYPQGDHRHSGLSNNLYIMQQTSGQLLPDYDLKHGEARRISSHPVESSGAFDIWEGEYLGKEKCAIKQVRCVEVTPEIRDRFLREVVIWRKLWEIDQGQYILPFWGAILNDGPYPFMVSPWMHYGDSLRFVINFPDVNRKKIIRRVALALQLLHSQDPPIAHGDIKAANILINKMGEPLLADFGLSKMMEDTGVRLIHSRGFLESYRWFAPELCSAPGILSPASDVFAFSMTILELMTGQRPFSHIKRTPEVLIRVQSGERPLRPTEPEVLERGLDGSMWNLLTRCWDANPEKRPTIHQILEELPVD
ncbi:kinase-like protein [Phellopilus nigrolimitatus]|nr:kinase-like protein [Phellopilus nigrolimitatus]